MKPLNKMNNLDKGELLCTLFPEELENLQRAMEATCNFFIQHEATLRKDWDGKQFEETEFWFALVKKARRKIDTYHSNPLRSDSWFSTDLFSGADGLFTVFCMLEYAKTPQCSSRMKFAIELLFGSHNDSDNN